MSDCPELLEPDLKMKDFKRIIKEKTGIIEENQRFHVFFEIINYAKYFHPLQADETIFWENVEIKIYDKSRYKTNISKNFYSSEVFLNLDKKIGELKQMIYEQTKIPINRQQIFLGEVLYSDDCCLAYENFFKEKLSIKIDSQLNDTIYIKYPNSKVKVIRTDLCSTALELLQKLDSNNINVDNPHGFYIKYNILYKNQKVPFTSLLVNSGINSGDMIELQNRNNIQLFVKTLTGKTIVICGCL